MRKRYDKTLQESLCFYGITSSPNYPSTATAQ
jgi:hypothetical protein